VSAASDRNEAALDLERQGREAIESYRVLLASPAFQHQIDLAVLVKIAGDEKIPPRERVRAAEALGRLRMEAMAAVADLTGTREQSLDTLGLKPGAQSLALTQIHQRIEIVRAKDWRSAPALEDGGAIDIAALPAGDEDHAEDPAP
jgi:hypothetical protein